MKWTMGIGKATGKQTAAPKPLQRPHSVPYQAVALDQETWRDKSPTRRGGISVYFTDTRCSNTVKVDAQCFPDVKLLTWRCKQYHHRYIVSAAYIHPYVSLRWSCKLSFCHATLCCINHFGPWYAKISSLDLLIQYIILSEYAKWRGH